MAIVTIENTKRIVGADVQRKAVTHDVELNAAEDQLIGIVIESPDATKYKIVVANGGALSAVAV